MIIDEIYFSLFENESTNTILESVADDVKRIESQISRLFCHLLKYRYQPQKQGSSWYRSIFGAYDDIIHCKYSANVMQRIDLDRCYFKGRKDTLLESGLAESIIPKERPYDWDIKFVTDIHKILNFIKQYHDDNTYNKGLEDFINKYQ